MSLTPFLMAAPGIASCVRVIIRQLAHADGTGSIKVADVVEGQIEKLNPERAHDAMVAFTVLLASITDLLKNSQLPTGDLSRNSQLVDKIWQNYYEAIDEYTCMFSEDTQELMAIYDELVVNIILECQENGVIPEHRDPRYCPNFLEIVNEITHGIIKLRKVAAEEMGGDPELELGQITF
ncbi:hypothetical protein N7532_003969 [Penicillium argentinense]|uniref:Uncharacterized protein n=1 Tax=Penicillium argentinense TaxID=1131581 RepID=A0A9W9KED4_9EURO|nr:uncharacterized protein N7532_003969 [Penicillium argentinense]KAJ5103440.1 hypothetical protein N7532_003969 [Penicillium argentinense]